MTSPANPTASNQLFQDIQAEIVDLSQTFGKPISWFKHARCCTQGYLLVIPPNNQKWQALNNVINRLNSKYPDKKLTEITQDLISFINSA